MQSNTVSLNIAGVKALADLMSKLHYLKGDNKNFKLGGILNITTLDGNPVGYIDMDAEKIELNYLNFSSGRSQE